MERVTLFLLMELFVLKLLLLFLPPFVVNFLFQLLVAKLLFNILAHMILYKHLVFKLPVNEFIFKLLVFKFFVLFLPLLVLNFLFKFFLYQLKFHFVILKLTGLTAPSGCPRWSMTCWRPVPIRPTACTWKRCMTPAKVCVQWTQQTSGLFAVTASASPPTSTSRLSWRCSRAAVA